MIKYFFRIKSTKICLEFPKKKLFFDRKWEHSRKYKKIGKLYLEEQMKERNKVKKKRNREDKECV